MQWSLQTGLGRYCSSPEHSVAIESWPCNIVSCFVFCRRTKKKPLHVISTTKRPVPLEHFLFTGNSTKTADELFKIVNENGQFQVDGWVSNMALQVHDYIVWYDSEPVSCHMNIRKLWCTTIDDLWDPLSCNWFHSLCYDFTQYKFTEPWHSQSIMVP